MKGSGTSFAASHVTGFIAALLDKYQPEDKNYDNEFVCGQTEKPRKEELVERLKTKVLDIFSKDNVLVRDFSPISTEKSSMRL
jgi:hypothetical protein